MWEMPGKETLYMPSPLDNEIRGDWNNLKGTEYHLVYVLWLLLCQNARSVAFYRGNDLLANPAPPPTLEEPSTFVPAVRVQDSEEYALTSAWKC